MIESKFNLLDEPWIVATNLSGQEEMLSVTETLVRSHELKGLSGEMPAQDIAIMRLLLGVLYAIYTRTAEYKEAQNTGSQDLPIEIWKAIWEQKHFEKEKIQKYLYKYYDRFWLIHAERPFYQVVGIDKGSEFTSAKMIGELVEGGNKIQLFPIRTGKSKQFLEYPEAARWLLYLNSFDDASAKPTQKGLESMSVGWLGRLGLVYALGDNLFETLMLNFSLLNNGEPWNSGNATWELDTPRVGERTPIPIPNSAEELYTLQSRRIQLKWENDKLIGFSLLGGDQASIENAFVEPMTYWKKSKSKENQNDVFSPPSNVSRNPTKQLWRDFAPLLIKSEENYLPGVIDWINRIDIISARQINICTLLIKYGNMQSGVDDVWSDSLSINASLLLKLGEDWIIRIANLVSLTEELVKILGNLATNIDIASGSPDGKGQRIAIQEQAYAALDMPFRNWLAEIDPENHDIDITCSTWINLAKKIILFHGESVVIKSGSKAFVGRNVNINGKEEYYNAPKAYGWFKSRIFNKIKDSGYERS